MNEVFEKVRMVAPTETTVMLTGETGTGKGVIARMIHDSSSRHSNQFISVHCGAIPEALIESELFGHERGAFTGAIRRKLGRFEVASGGTIFLDEIGTMTAATQIKLLQVLQDQTFQPLGGEKTVKADVRVVAASNINLEEMCRKGEFRSDLYYRLNVFPIHIPSLQERPEDIPLFVGFFIKHINKFNPRKIIDVTPEVMSALKHYQWPGNIREMENLIQRASIIEKSSILTRPAFPQELFDLKTDKHDMPGSDWPTLADTRLRAVTEAEEQYLCSVLTDTCGRINQTAKIAGVSRRQIHKLLTRYCINKNEFKAGGSIRSQKNRPS
jgi:transcriptional regulator with GAF, ATPase, and Fis domain